MAVRAATGLHARLKRRRIMRNFLLFVLCCVAIVAALGFYLDWFNLRTTRTADNQSEVTLSVDRDRVKEDVAAVRKRADEVTGKVSEYFADHTVEGVVESVNPADGTLNLKPNDQKQPVISLRVDKDTKIQMGDAGGKDRTLSDVQTGNRATVVYETRKEYNRAKSITILAASVAVAGR
jgi:hypothetical protein